MAKLIRNANGELETSGDAGGEPATTTTAGSMSAEDKLKLDALEVGGEGGGAVPQHYLLYKTPPGALGAPPLFVRDAEDEWTLPLGWFDLTMFPDGTLPAIAIIMRTRGDPSVGTMGIKVSTPGITVGGDDPQWFELGLTYWPEPPDPFDPTVWHVLRDWCHVPVFLPFGPEEQPGERRFLSLIRLWITFAGPGAREIDYVEAWITTGSVFDDRGALGWGSYFAGESSPDVPPA